MRGRVQTIVIALLLALPPLNDELRRSLIRCVPELRVGLGLLNRGLQLNELSLSLFELLVEIGRGDRRQDLVLGHMSADVFVPRRNVAAGAGEERTGVKCCNVARQHQLLFSRSTLRLHNSHRRSGLRVGPGCDLLSALGAFGDAEEGEAGRADRKNEDDKQDATRFRFGRSGGNSEDITAPDQA